jgi:cardiolipin synthase (CMP-forming)
MTIPNMISLLRMLLVPLAIWLMLSDSFMAAFYVFIAAGISDGVDGYLARRFSWQSELGAYLDAIADKALLVSIYVVLGVLRIIPVWLVIIVVTRDILIVGGVMLSRVLDMPIRVKPLWISKVNTVGQIIFAGLLLLLLGTGYGAKQLLVPGAAIVALLTLASGALYARDWLRHMSSGEKT